jgi:ligand-binding SRPBCC domain-containing protein
MAKSHRLERTQVIPRPRDEVFAFFSDASNLQRITPAFVGFEVLTPGPLVIEAGTRIDYRLKLYGVPVRWETRIETFVPGVSFTDVQLSGPYRRWHHLHAFVDIPGGTRMDDTVDYELPLGVLGEIARKLFVARSLEKIFDYRAQQIGAMFGSTSSPLPSRELPRER